MSFPKITPAERTLKRLFQPLFHAAPVKNVPTRKFFNDFLLFESLNANRASPGTFFHNHGLDSFLFDLMRKLLNGQYIIKAYDFS